VWVKWAAAISVKQIPVIGKLFDLEPKHLPIVEEPVIDTLSRSRERWFMLKTPQVALGCVLLEEQFGYILPFYERGKLAFGNAPSLLADTASAELSAAQPAIDCFHSELEPFGSLLRC
jgi:hypothetical protein